MNYYNQIKNKLVNKEQSKTSDMPDEFRKVNFYENKCIRTIRK